MIIWALSGARKGLQKMWPDIDYPPRMFEIEKRKLLLAHDVGEIRAACAERRPDALLDTDSGKAEIFEIGT